MRLRSLLVLLLLALSVVALPSSATAAPTWAPAASATIKPGVQTVTDGGQCTANFVFYDANGAVYVGQSAHCAGTGAANDTNGCETGSLPLGTPVTVKGASAPGTLVYSSWLAMRGKGETDPNACAYNDFALVQLNSADYGKVNPSVPIWGGPTRVGGGSALGKKVYSYGNSGLRFGLSALSPKEGYSLGESGGGWTHDVYTVTPGVPGDSGSAFLSADGGAMGTLSTLAFLPFPASNGVSDLGNQLAYARAVGGFDNLQLATGTEPFKPGLLP